MLDLAITGNEKIQTESRDMLRRLIIFTTSFVLCGVLVLSVPIYANNGATSGKATNMSASGVVKATMVKPISNAATVVHPTMTTILRYYIRSLFGLPIIQIEVKSTETSVPQKSDHDTNRWQDKAKDNGGSSVDF